MHHIILSCFYRTESTALEITTVTKITAIKKMAITAWTGTVATPIAKRQ